VGTAGLEQHGQHMLHELRLASASPCAASQELLPQRSPQQVSMCQDFPQKEECEQLRRLVSRLRSRSDLLSCFLWRKGPLQPRQISLQVIHFFLSFFLLSCCFLPCFWMVLFRTICPIAVLFSIIHVKDFLFLSLW
jgi:hypothetical protein